MVVKGSAWVGGVAHLPPGRSATGKMGVLGADGKPAVKPGGEKYSATEKQAILDKEQQMKDAETGKAPKPETNADTLTLTDYRRKGANAYLVPVTVNNGQISRGAFDSGNSDNYGRAGAGKANTRTIDLKNKPDGWYEYQEGAHGSRHTYRGYIQVKGGKIVDEVPSSNNITEAKNNFLSKVAPVKSMPSLNGSQRQVSWAESIREKAVRSGKITAEQASRVSESKWWIDNRSKF